MWLGVEGQREQSCIGFHVVELFAAGSGAFAFAFAAAIAAAIAALGYS